jgi:hypothetical protein
MGPAGHAHAAVPMMKMSRKATWMSAGMDSSSVLNTICKLLTEVTSRSGRKTRKARRDLMSATLSPEFSSAIEMNLQAKKRKEEEEEKRKKVKDKKHEDDEFDGLQKNSCYCLVMLIHND